MMQLVWQWEQAQTVIARTRDEQITHVDLQFTDIMGGVKSVQIPVRQLESAFRDGFWFDGSALQGFARVAEYDMYLRPDPTTYAVLPWDQGEEGTGRTARLICTVQTPANEDFPGDPRMVLQRAIDLGLQMGFRYFIAPELEFFLLRQPAHLSDLQAQDRASYFDISDAKSRAIRREIENQLAEMGIAVDASHHEVGDGQHELDFAPLEALHMADALLTAKLAVRAIASKHGLLATFMPKPFAHVAGSGMHIHQVLHTAHTMANSFTDTNDAYGLSRLGRAFLAGQLAHAPGICAILAPLVNSYKRLVAGQEAPVYVTWAQLNRSALIRVPRVRAGHNDQARIELRCVDPSCNPYLAFAVMLRAGLDGVAKNLELPNPAEEEIYLFNARRHGITTLPISLHEALLSMERSDLANEALGQHIYEGFLEAKRLEWNDYALEVSAWELRRYL
jgi:glutamine synthetase